VPILTSRGPVKIDDNLKIVFRCPADCFEEVVVLPLDKRFARNNFVGPIPDWDAHVIEPKNSRFRPHCKQLKPEHTPGTCDIFKVILGNPCVPMRCQFIFRDLGVLVLPERPLVNNRGIARAIEQTRLYPWLREGR